MTPEELMEAVDLTDDQYIAEAAVPPAKKKIFGVPGVKAALAVAACLAVFLSAGLILRKATTPTHTESPTTDGTSVSETAETTTEKERTTTEKVTEATEESSAEITEPPIQRPTEPPTEEPSAPITEPTSQTPASDAEEPTGENYAPTAPPEQRTEETTAEEPQSEPTTEEKPAEKTIEDILSVLGLFDSTAGDTETTYSYATTDCDVMSLESVPPKVFTVLTEEEITAIFGFSPSEKIVLPDGYRRDETLFNKTEEDGRETFNAVYAFAKETDVVYFVLQKDNTAFSTELFDTPPVSVNGTDVYLMTGYDEYTDGSEPYRNCLAAFECGGLTGVLLGMGYSVTTEELLIFAGNLLQPA